ncbi:IclR family transcriptional regulator [Oceanicella sp. SM1341]|uniref:IclR family transcriptional regulator n=1 Tax=Oceanicella sp. SM1341 TaxID=1548889 RepID=UPI000E4D1DB0|nr:IclR family transcriptional regulator [Oceanicella sp. SM1341]
MDYTISAVDRAIGLLEALVDLPGAGVSDLAERTGNTKSLTFRLLYTLEQRGFVAKDAERRTYSLGHRAMLLGDQARRQSRLVTSAQPFMRELGEKTEQNVLLLIRDGLCSICVSLRSAPNPQRIFAEVGRRGPLYAGGGPKVLLAFAPEEVIDQVAAGPMTGFTTNTLKDGDSLRAALATIRRDGWTVSESELDYNTCSAAAPVRNQSGEVVAALSVTGSSDRMSGEAQREVLDAVVSASHRLSAMLGWGGAPFMAS